MSRNLSQPEDRIGVKLTSTERSALLEGLTFLPSKYEQLIRDTPLRVPVMLSPDDLDKLGRYIANEAKETHDRKRGKKLDAIFSRIKKLFAPRIEAEPTGTISVDDVIKSEMLTRNVEGNVTGVAEFVAAALRVADSRGIKAKPLEFFYLAPAQREVLLAVPSMKRSIRTKLKEGHASFTVAEVASMTISLAEFSVDATGRQQFAALLVVDHLTERLKTGIPGISDAESGSSELAKKSKMDARAIYQFKITLIGSNPPIWRRFQVADCNLDKFHEHIQTVMGWTNSHLHQFAIEGKYYTNPELLAKGFCDASCVDSTRTRISSILPKSGKPFRFTYEYDFGDSWNHEILFEGCPKKESGIKYPLCVEGEQACPPEDVGGIGGFSEFLEALADPNHDQHEVLTEWAGEFHPEMFDARQATRKMKRGLPDWRQM